MSYIISSTSSFPAGPTYWGSTGSTGTFGATGSTGTYPVYYSPTYPAYTYPTTAYPVNTPMIVSSDSPAPFIPSINLTYTHPTFSYYKNLSADPYWQDRIVKNTYYKVLDKWMYDELSDLLKYFVAGSNGVELVRSIDQAKETSDNIDVIEKKIDFIEQNLFKEHDMEKIIRKFLRETNLTWVDIPKNYYFLKDAVKHYLKKKIKQKITEKK